MKINSNTRITLTRTNVHVETPASEDGAKVEELTLKYNLNKDVHTLTMDFTDRLAEVFGLTAYGQICTRCGNCCKRENIFVRGADIFSIALELGITTEKFRKKYLKEAGTWNPYDGFIKLKRGKCPFLKRKPSGRYACSIHSVRPLACRNFLPMSLICKKDPGFMNDFLEKVEIKGDHALIQVHEEEEEGKTYNGRLRELPVVINDLELLDVLGKLKAALNLCSGENTNLVQKSAKKASNIINRMLDNYAVESEKKNFVKKVKDLRLIVSNLADMTTNISEDYQFIDELWSDLFKLENAEIYSKTDSRDFDRTNYDRILLEGDWGVLGSISIQPTQVFYNFIKDDGIETLYTNLNEDKQQLEAVREMIQLITTLPGEEYQKNLAEQNPPCYLCGECCSCFGVEIKTNDIIRLADNLKMTEKQFRKEYLNPCKFSWNRYSGVLKNEKEKEETLNHCRFLFKKDNLFFCSIHEFKPEVCGGFPATHKVCRMTNYRDYWYRLISNLYQVELDKETLTLTTERTFASLYSNVKIKWKENSALAGAVNKFLKETGKLIDKKLTHS